MSYSGDQGWREEALCSKKENSDLVDLFFSDELEDKHKVKNLCFSCPVREDCIKYALESKEIWGVWGGRDENEIRRTLSVDADGNEYRRDRFPQCPYCSARTSRLTTYIIDLPGGGRWTTARMVKCLDCEFEWRSRTSANAINAYHSQREDKRARRASKRLPQNRTLDS
jgi:WhiB family redox-sensing transcriptional regulator